MKYYSFLLLTVLLQISFLTVNAVDVVVPEGVTRIASYNDAQVTVSNKGDLHLTSATPLTNSTITLASENAWVFFDNLRPSEVIANWLQYVKVGGAQAVNGSNVRVEIYVQGTVVIPHTPAFEPLEVFDGSAFSGNSQTYDVGYHKSLGTMDDKIRSFKLKRGYMATLATFSNGRGFSRVFIANTNDVEVPQLQAELDKTVSFIRVFKWMNPSVKGVCGSNDGYVQLTQSTWWNNWGGGSETDSHRNDYEYVPMWNKLNGNWDAINSRTNVTHLLGLNEPDHSEQHKDDNNTKVVTVERAIQEWPKMLESGLRVGSPACTDTGWLFDFIDECDRLNYRVDFVAWHAYWGGKSPQSWYNDLKYIHERTGRPVWITEWNNGANWTNEGGWDRNSASTDSPKPLLDTEANKQKQLHDIEAILEVLDTTSFIERQSLYNWVETARMIVTNSDVASRALTPAGLYFRDDKSQTAFNKNKEYTPTWKIPTPKVLSSTLSTNKTELNINLNSSVYDELIVAYIVERQTGNNQYVAVDTITNRPIVTRLTIPINISQEGKYAYRVRAIDVSDSISAPSVETSFVVTSNEDIQIGQTPVTALDWMTMYYGKAFTAAPATILGIPGSNSANTRMSNRIKTVTTEQLKFKFYPWNYINQSGYTNADNLPFLILPVGAHAFGNVNAWVGKATTSGTWSTVSFNNAPANYFNEPPVIIPTQVTDNSTTATSIHIRNVTTTGFEVCLRKEATQTYTISTETIHYIALSAGEGLIGGKKIVVGKIDSVGHVNRLAKTFHWNGAIETPLFYAHKQTVKNDYASNLRIQSNKTTEAKIINQIEGSTNVTVSDQQTDSVGWVVIEGQITTPTGIENISSSQPNQLAIYPNPVVDILYFDNANNEDVKVNIFNLQGILVKIVAGKINQVDVSNLPRDCYFVNINGKYAKILKR